MPLLLVSYAVEEMFLAKIAQPSPYYGCKKNSSYFSKSSLRTERTRQVLRSKVGVA